MNNCFNKVVTYFFSTALYATLFTCVHDTECKRN